MEPASAAAGLARRPLSARPVMGQERITAPVTVAAEAEQSYSLRRRVRIAKELGYFVAGSAGVAMAPNESQPVPLFARNAAAMAPTQQHAISAAVTAISKWIAGSAVDQVGTGSEPSVRVPLLYMAKAVLKTNLNNSINLTFDLS